MNDLIELMRRVVREEMALQRGPQLATITHVHTHQSDDDSTNYEADVRLKHDGLEIPQVPIAISHVGFVAPPRVGDLVMLQFLNNDIQQPLITGRFYHDQERPPLYEEDEVLFEHRLPDGTINQLRMAADGSILLQRDVQKPEDNSEFLAGIRIDPEGLIELKTSDEVVLTLDQQNGKITLLCKDKPVDITCSTLTVDGDVQISKTLTVDGDGTIKGNGKISSVSISGTTITGG
jgi:phage baseplate assembly protein gpV